MKLNSKIYVAGHNGLVGSAITRNLKSKGYTTVITKNKNQLNLIDQKETNAFFKAYQPEYVFLAAAKVGGILANREQKADFIYENIMIQTNVINAAYQNGVKKLLFLGSSCIYPKEANIPIAETELMTGPLEPTNDAYAIAKIAGVKMCQSYKQQYNFNAIALMPTNLYGPEDNFHPANSHVLPGLMKRFDDAKEQNKNSVMCWGDGSPLREFLFIDDLAEACVFCMKHYNDSEILNVGTGEDVSIKTLVEMISSTVGYKGNIEWNTEMPNGTHRKVLNIDRIKNLGWNPKISLDKGLEITYDWYRKNRNALRGGM